MSRSLPTLTDSRRARLAVFAIYYGLQGAPLGLTFIALPAWFAEHGFAKEAIATFAAVTSLPLTLKVFASPLMDRFTYWPMGERRPWILMAQALFCLTSCGLLLISDPAEQFRWLLAICTTITAVAFAGDNAVDGLAILVTPEAERGKVNAAMTAGLVLGMSLTAAAAIRLLDFGGFAALGLFLSIVSGSVALLTLLVREHDGDRFLPWSRGGVSRRKMHQDGIYKLLAQLFRAATLPTSLLMLAVMLLGRSVYGIYKVWAPYLAIARFDYTDAQYSEWFSIVALVCAGCALGIGVLIDRWGLFTAYRRGFVAVGVLYVVAYFFVDLLSNPWVGLLYMLLFELADTLMYVPYVAIGMTLCHVRIAAMQYSFYIAIGTLGQTAGSAAFPAIVDAAGLMNVFLINAGLCLAAWLLLSRFQMDRHKASIANLDLPGAET